MAAAHPPEEEADWVHGHAHEPNALPPAGDGDFVVRLPGGGERVYSPAGLAALPQCEVPGCLIVSTGHGTSGPFTFGGVRLADLLAHALREERNAEEQKAERQNAEAQRRRDAEGLAEGLAGGRAQGHGGWRSVDVVSADGFGTRLLPAHLADERAGPILLALRCDGAPLTRAGGLVRLIVPSEREDALRQVKWVARVEMR